MEKKAGRLLYRENENLMVIDPFELKKNNPAALIVNQESYNRIAPPNFSPNRFDSPQVVKVETYASGKRSFQYLIVDGMTRTMAVCNNLDKVKHKYPDFQFTVNDVTKAALQDSSIVPFKERKKRQEALTFAQYFRMVVPPTVVHAQIAPERVVSHLIKGWKDIIGEKLSERYSALAAISLLGNIKMATFSEESLKDCFKKQPKMLSEETARERTELEEGLLEMARMIRDTKLIRQNLANCAFALVGKGSETIGGEKEARNQVYGLLHTHDLETKIEKAFPNLVEREQKRNELGMMLSDSLVRAANSPRREEVINILNEVMGDPRLEFRLALQVFSSEDPIRDYDEIRKKVNRNHLTSLYLDNYRPKDKTLTPSEEQMIRNLGGRAIITKNDLGRFIQEVHQAERVLGKHQAFVDNIPAKENLEALGISPGDLNQALERLDQLKQEMLSADSVVMVSKKSSEIVSLLTEVNDRFKRKLVIQKISEIVDQNENNGDDPERRRGLITYLYQNFKDGSDGLLIKKRMEELSGLDKDLQLKVLIGDLPLNIALRRKKEREVAMQALVDQQNKATGSIPKTAEKAVFMGIPFPDDSREIAQSQPRPQSSSHPQTSSKITDSYERQVQELERERKEKQVNILAVLLENLDRELNKFDLSAEDTKGSFIEGQLISVVRRLGVLAFNHPDIVRVMKRDYPYLQNQIIELRSKALQKENQELLKETMTK